MKKRIKMLVALTIVALMGLGSAAVMAVDHYVPEGATTKTAVFYVMEDYDAPGVEFSMLSQDGELVIHIAEDTPVYFPEYLPISDEPGAETSRNARDLLLDQTLAEMMDNRNLLVTYAVTTRSIPPQTTPISVVILFETPVHPILELDYPFDFDMDNGTADDGEYAGFVTLPASLLPFVDVDVNDWFFTSIAWAFENEIMNGISETEFGPDGTMTRAMLVTVLWRYAGEPWGSQPTFDDVALDSWYSMAIAWAAENDIVAGFSDSEFGPNNFVNREQMYTILHRYMNFAGLTIALEEEMRLQQFADDELVSDWAREALHFMFDAGVMFRYSSMDNYARPQADATRGEIAGAMYFFDMWAH